MTFKEYIASVPIDDSPEGDFVADARGDQNFRDFTSLQELLGYLSCSRQADFQVREVAKNVWENYQAFKEISPHGYEKSVAADNVKAALLRIRDGE